MRPEMMLDEIAEIKKHANKEVREVLLTYAKAHNPYKIGDIIEDHCCIGRITRVVCGISTEGESFNFVYKCDRLKKNLEPFKSGEKVDIFLDNIEKKY